MAEGWARYFHKDWLIPYSAGIATHGLNPYAVKAMAEADVDISDHTSKLVDSLNEVPFDLVVTVCGHADESCPVWLGKAPKRHHGFPDPPKMAHGLTSEAEILACYTQVRDQIKSFVQQLEL